MHFTIRVLRTCPELGLRVGDVVTFEPELEPPESLLLHRSLSASPDALLQLLQSGAADLVSLHSTVSDFAEAVGWSPPQAVKPPAASPVPKGRIDVEAALEALATSDVGSFEPRAIDILPWPDASRRLLRTLDRIRRKRPRPCRVCGVEFVGRQVHVFTCDPCKVAGRKRCPTCNEVFNTTNPKAKRCANCRART